MIAVFCGFVLLVRSSLSFRFVLEIDRHPLMCGPSTTAPLSSLKQFSEKVHGVEYAGAT